MTALTITIYAATLLIWATALYIATRAIKRQRSEIREQSAKIDDLRNEVLQVKIEKLGIRDEQLAYEIANLIDGAEYKAEGNKVWRIAVIDDGDRCTTIHTLIKRFTDPDESFNLREAEDLAKHLNEK